MIQKKNDFIKIYFLLCLILSFFLSACEESKSIRIGTISGPETTLMESAKAILEKEHGLTINIIEFSDYSLPNTALEDGSIDANMFQHAAYLAAENEARGYHLVGLAKTFIYPMGLYSQKIQSLKQLSKHALVAIPNDPTNESRALLLLQAAKLITVPDKSILTPQDILHNPFKLVFKELDAAQLPRTLEDVTLAAINTNYAIPAGLLPKRDAVFLEKSDSPYANLFVVKKGREKDQDLLKVIQTLHSNTIRDEAKQLFKDQAIPAW